jgi:hypothetical protein
LREFSSRRATSRVVPEELSGVSIRRLVTFYVREHNHVLPHSAFGGKRRTRCTFAPERRVPGELTSRAAAARRARLEANRSALCTTCSSLSAA